MKLVFTIFLSFLIHSVLLSQDFMVKDFRGEIITGFQTSKTTTFKIQNFSNSSKSIRIKHSLDKIQGGGNFTICYDDICNTDNEFLIINIPANSITNDIELTLTGGLSNLNTITYLEFIDLQIDNVIKKELSLKINEEKQKDIFFEKGDIIVSSFFPNPSVKNAILEYNINPYETEAKITLQNVLGSIIETYELSPDENKLNINTENLNPGVYFYTLSIRDEGLATRKLIVKK
ncbi:T9SS type A sorting domain-containing protein [Marivirga arenosa]|uniref:T9SS type A sorting domain-containing protein n=1 Tax=Marivirga arenosa TaxID=3059076 RepID=A0AA51N535_9BACT|nr:MULTISPECIES: T9SS type A sorting domain-containing protein [unclassified Marivirga]WKK80006.1 T9SS type A sorting domain-containing protein [Marivirga sp. BKB1-2]WMN06461.1 T9SS type A sorting domain-containing protein [Marivirga sp. ABR2-2]